MIHIDDTYIKEHLMGPNAALMLQELLEASGLCGREPFGSSDACGEREPFESLGSCGQKLLEASGSRGQELPLICDLGCGKGLTSLLLAERTGAEVWACDLWIDAEENQAEFNRLGYGDKVRAVKADATEMTFPEGHFDALVSVDSYHYFAHGEGDLDRYARMVKPGGKILLCFPGFVRPLDDAMMEVLGLSWSREDMELIWSIDQWRTLWGKATTVSIDDIFAMECFDQAWNDWLSCDNEYAMNDRAAMESGGRDLMILIGAVLTKR